MPKPNKPRVDPITDLPLDSDDLGLRDQRRAFYESVLSIHPKKPMDDLRRLCRAWREFLGAKWVWLWLFHHGNADEEGHWELTAVEADGPNEAYVPLNLTPTNGPETTAEFSSVIGRPVLVTDIVRWKRSHDGKHYRVVLSDDLALMGCKSLVCLPLIPPKDGGQKDHLCTSKFRRPLRAALCAHFNGSPPIALEGERSLTLMGRLSAHFIANSYEAAEHRILTQMNSLAEEFLTRKTKTRRPEEDRSDYLKRVIKLIQEHLSVQYVSVFYRNHANDAIVCIATTGLHDSSGKSMKEFELAKITYAPNESLTGTVFGTGNPYFSRIGQVPARPKYKYRETPMEVPETDLAWVIYPIAPLQADVQRRLRPDVFGVVRCVGNLAQFAPDRKRNIDPLQIQTLDFIARMLAPVLETMASNIERERVISIIKHDLFAPLKMMEDTIRNTAERLAEGKAPNEYFVPDLQFCIHTAINLVSGLDQAPTELRDFSPMPTSLEGMVAAVSNMLRPHARIENDMDIRFGDIRNAIPKLGIDRNLISRALSNLIVNAIKYGRPSTTIFIDARDDPRGYYLEIHNEGEGVTDEDRSRIFQEGYRSPRAKKKKLGLGMGLPIAKAIMEMHGGRLMLVSASNPTVFSMFFPARLRC